MKRAKIALITVLVIVAICTTACGSSSNHNPMSTPALIPGFTTYTNSSLGFSIAVPDSWGITPNVDIGFILFSSHELCSGGVPGAEVMKQDSDEDLQSQYQRSKRTAEFFIEDYAFISDESTEIDGISAMSFVYTGVSLSGTPFQTMNIDLIYEQTWWNLTFSCPQACWSAYEGVFDTMANSFQVLD